MSGQVQNEIDSCGSITKWLDGIKQGASEAQQRIWNRYLEQVVRYADYRLRALGVRSQEGDDIAQQVFVGFFRRAEAGQYPDLNDRGDLWHSSSPRRCRTCGPSLVDGPLLEDGTPKKAKRPKKPTQEPDRDDLLL